MKKIIYMFFLLTVSNMAFSKKSDMNIQTIDYLERLETVVAELSSKLDMEEVKEFQWLQNVWKNYITANCLWIAKLTNGDDEIAEYNLCMQDEISRRILSLRNLGEGL